MFTSDSIFDFSRFINSFTYLLYKFILLPSWKYDVTAKIRLCWSMRIRSRDNPAKFHPHRIWNDWDLGFLLVAAQQEQQEEEEEEVDE